MKIVILNIYQDLVDRGAETFVYEVAKRLSKNHQVTVICGGRSKKPYKIIKIAGINIYPTDKPDLLWRLLHKFYLDPHSRQVYQFTKKTLPHIIKENPDWIISLNGFWQLIQIKRLQKKMKFKILVSGQAGVGKDDYWNLKLKPDVFVALTNSTESWAKEISRTKIVKIPNGVDLDKFNPDNKPVKLNLPKPWILCVGALVPYKRIDLTISAVSKLNASLIIIGQGPMEVELKRQAKNLLKNRFLITTIKSDEIPKYYAGTDLFTLASDKSEAFGIAYLESLASGKPVVAPNHLSKKEIIGDAGIFFNQNSLEDYVVALRNALKKNWQDLPRMQAVKFDWEIIAKNYQNIFSTY